jgi:hypothetical protein
MNIHNQKADHLSRYVARIGALTPENLGELESLINKDIVFRDPFNETRGAKAYMHVMAHMFQILNHVRFDIHAQAGSGSQHFLYWTFSAEHGSLGKFEVEGMTRLELDEQGQIAAHIDYWDSDSAFMARIPVVGGLVRLLRKQMAIQIPD